MAVFFASSELLAIEEAQKRIQGILGTFPEMYACEHDGDLRIPPGWIDVLIMALEDATINGAELQIRKLSAKYGSLFAEFASGTEAAKKSFQSILAQANEYCPCCGSLWADTPQRYSRDK